MSCSYLFFTKQHSESKEGSNSDLLLSFHLKMISTKVYEAYTPKMRILINIVLLHIFKNSILM